MAKKSKEKQESDLDLSNEFTIKLNESKVLKVLFEMLSTVFEEIKINVDKSGIYVNITDPSRICMLRLVIKRNSFDTFEVNKNSSVCLNIEDFNKILKRIPAQDELIISFKPEDQKLRIQTKPEGKERLRTFSLANLELDIEDVDMGNLLSMVYDCKWVFDITLLENMLKDAVIFNETISIEIIEETVSFKTSGMIGEYDCEIDESDLIEAVFEDNQSGTYAINFLKSICKLGPIIEKLEISLKNDHPLKIKLGLLEGGDIFFFLAPRVEEADFDEDDMDCLLYTSPSPRDRQRSRMPSSA